MMIAEPLPSFSQRLKELREKAGLTQQELANQAELSMSIVTQMEIGRRTDPRLSTLLALARVLKTDLNTLGDLQPPAKKRGRPRKGA